MSESGSRQVTGTESSSASLNPGCQSGTPTGGTVIRALWGKAPERLAQGQEPYPLSAHLLDTLAVAEALWDTWLSPHLRRFLTENLAPDVTDGTTGLVGTASAGRESGSHELVLRTASRARESLAKQWSCFTAAAHDVGKANGDFQMQASSSRAGLDAWRTVMSDRLAAAGLAECDDRTVRSLQGPGRGARRHEFVGMMSMAGLDADGPGDLFTLHENWIAAVVGGHHGRWQPEGTSNDDSANATLTLMNPAWRATHAALIEVVKVAACLFGHEPPVLDPTRAGAVITLLTGFTILADWIASSDEVVVPGHERIRSGDDPFSPTWAALRRNEIRSIVEHSVGGYVPPPDPMASFLGTDADGNPRTPRPLQAEAAGIGGGVWFVAYPTGEGKTEAALLRHAAGEPEGLVFGLPTRATTDEMQRRLTARFGSTGNTVLLSHGFAAAHHVECASEYGLEWFSSSIRRLLAPVVAATCDQVLVGALRQRHSPLRLLGLANHHIVLDEVHTYDQYQSHLLKQLLAWWGVTGTRVTLLSATLPAWQQRDFAAAYLRSAVPEEDAPPPVYPGHWTVTDRRGAARTPPTSGPTPDLCFTVTRADDATAVHTAWAVRSHETHPRCHAAVIRSTVQDTVETARVISEAVGNDDVDVVCLHSRMTVGHRQALQQRLEARLGPRQVPGRALIVVASQVIESALDYDFDLMASDLVPAAALLQRAGRLWRFPDGAARQRRFGTVPWDRTMDVVVRTLDGRVTGKSALPYFASELERVVAWLEAHDRIRVPADVQGFVDDTSMDLKTVRAADAAAEIASSAVRIEAADRATSRLWTGIAAPRRRTRYADLVDLTGGATDASPVDEDRMGTRFIDLESETFVLLGGTWGAPIDVGELSKTVAAEEIRAALGASVPVSHRDMIQALRSLCNEATEGTWRPRSALLRGCRPVPVAALAAAGLTYDDVFGLVSAPSDHVTSPPLAPEPDASTRGAQTHA